MKAKLMARRQSSAKLSRHQRWLAATTALLMSAAAPAALMDRGGGMVYDTTLDISWWSDWNHARTSGLSVDGRMHLSDATDWAQSLVHGG